MDRNSVIGLILIALILIGFNLWFMPSQTETAVQNTAKKDSTIVNKITDTSTKIQVQTDSSNNKTADEERQIVLQNNVMTATLSNKGGTITKVELKNYKTFNKKPLVLFDQKSQKLSYNYALNGSNVNTLDLTFDIVAQSTADVQFSLVLGNGTTVIHRYSLKENSYLVDHSVQIIDPNKNLVQNNKMAALKWEINTPILERSIKDERANSTLYYKPTEDDVDKIAYTSDNAEAIEKPLKWVSFKQKFFNTALIATDKFEKADVFTKTPLDESFVKQMGSTLMVPLKSQTDQTLGFTFYFGPNHYNTLKAVGNDLEKQIALGWGIFGWVNKFLIIPLFNWLSSMGINFGIIILILTIIIKVVLFPLTYKSFVSGAKMRILKPEMDELKIKYEKDPTKLQAENLQLFQKAGVNPLGGCLPLLFQLPILIAMFNFFPASIELRQQPFLWATDLSSYDSIWNFGYVPVINTIYGDHVSLFTLLMTISTLIYTKMNNQMMGANNQMAWIGYVMPILFLGILNNYSAGLSYYYFLSNVISFLQMYIIRKTVDENKLHLQIQENKKRPASAQKSAFQKRLEEMARQQQQVKKR